MTTQPAEAAIKETPEWLWKILQKRGVKSTEDIGYKISRLIHPKGLKDLDRACTLIMEALESDQPIVIAGDYDVDGATGSALAVQALRAFGSSKTSYQIPNRFEQGYGLSVEVINRLHEQGVKLVITVDNGITAHQAIARARELNIKTIITDHHLPDGDGKLPDADAIINPNQPNCNFECKNLAGVGVIFYLLSAVRSKLREKHWFVFRKIREPKMTDYLDLVALGTVADMATLDYNNRVLVDAGLRKIRRGKASFGLACLLQIAGVKANKCSSRDIGFSLAPPLNAAGRLDSMDKGINCILANSWPIAWQAAHELVEINNQRKKLQSKMTSQAIHMIEKDYKNKQLPELIVLHHHDWHQGITGVVAGNIKDSYQKACIILTKTDDNILKGSGRANNNLHLRNLLHSIQDSHPDIFIACGGHAAAAGMTIHEDKINKLRQCIDEKVAHFINKDYSQEIEHDGSLSLDKINLETAQLIEETGPWGMGFQEPIFYGSFKVIEQSIVAERHLRMTLEADGTRIPAIAFNINRSQWPNRSVTYVDIHYYLHINRFQGKESLQLTIDRLQVQEDVKA